MFCPRESIEEVVDFFRLSAKTKKLNIKTQCDIDLPRLFFGDDIRIRQVLINLIGNAIKFTEEGEIDISIKQVISPESNQVLLRYSITDTGIGIPKNQHERLFDRFYQLDETSTRKYGGTGLGLPISKGLIELMGGEIGVISEVGQGSEFYFELPFLVEDTLE